MKKYLLTLLLVAAIRQSYLHAQTLNLFLEGMDPSGSTLIKLREGLYLIRAGSLDYGCEPYYSDGTQSGTFLLKDINVGSNGSCIIYPDVWFHRINDSLCTFVANDGDTNHGAEVWRTNGTTSGTYMVADLTPGDSSSYIVFSDAVLNNQTFFTTTTFTHIFTLYITDGTTAGTVPLLTGFDYLNPNITGKIQGVANGIAYFYEAAGPDDPHLWRTDGTVGGTYELLDPGVLNYSGPFVATLDNYFLFAASDSLHGQELWKTDGSVSGTTMIKDLNPGVSGSDLDKPQLLGNKIIFLARPNDTIEAVWMTDGTSSGTAMLGDSTVFHTFYCEIVGSTDSSVYFKISGDSIAIWRTDGTISGTSLLHTFYCSACDVQSGNITDNLAEAYGLTFFIFNEYQGYNSETASIWATDGTELGTYQVYANPDTEYNPIRDLTAACGQIFCRMIMGYFGESDHLWRVDQDTAYNLVLLPYYDYPFIYMVDEGSIFLSLIDSSGEQLYNLQVCPAAVVQNISASNPLSLYPNPNDGLFTLELPDNLCNAEVRVNDMMGKCRYTNKISASRDRKLNLRLEKIPPGIYSLQITSDGKRWQQIFIKQ